MKLSLAAARRLAVASQGLDGRWKLPAGAEGVARAVERLGYVQIDTIAVVQRAHHHTLWARRADYHVDMLHQLQAVDRRVFEYWAPAAAYLPMEHFRFHVRRMPGCVERATDGFLAGNRRLAREVLARIRAEGPLGSADFKAPPGRRRGPWWDWKHAKKALEALFSAGELMIAERRNFQRRYDLTERVLPAGVDTTPPTPAECGRFHLRRVLRAAGISTLNHWSIRRHGAAMDALVELLASGEVTPVTVPGLDAGPWYALADARVPPARRRGRPRPLHILSPFDSLLAHRRRVAALFGFDYKLECYVPAAKRRWGYFCLPILWGEAFIGRLDAKADRKARTLLVRKLMFEPGFQDYDAVASPLADRLGALAAFNGCDRVTVERTTPAKARAPVRRALKGRA